MKEDKYNSVYELVCKVVLEFNLEVDSKIDTVSGRNTRLFGGDAPLSSLELVTLIVYIEDELEHFLGHSITLANDRAMSRRLSPFSTIGLLVDYIVELISE
jgi:hypothetical protein